MKIWLDGDACPKTIKTILFRAVNRTKTILNIVANHYATAPPSPYIHKIKVPMGFDVADNHIVNEMDPGDLVITADIPLADAVVSKGGRALNPRGTLYTKQNIKQYLAIRDLNESLRSNGMISSNQSGLGPKEIQLFANHLDRLLSN